MITFRADGEPLFFGQTRLTVQTYLSERGTHFASHEQACKKAGISTPETFTPRKVDAQSFLKNYHKLKASNQ